MLGMLAVAVVAGCGETTSKVKSTVPREGPTTSTTAGSQPQPTEAGHTSSSAREASHEEPRAVPNEVHMRLAAAERDLQTRGVPYRVVGGGSAGSSPKPDLTVCETNPAAGTHLESGTTVRLIVGRSC
jgi:hypothetical protein